MEATDVTKALGSAILHHTEQLEALKPLEDRKRAASHRLQASSKAFTDSQARETTRLAELGKVKQARADLMIEIAVAERLMDAPAKEDFVLHGPQTQATPTGLVEASEVARWITNTAGLQKGTASYQ